MCSSDLYDTQGVRSVQRADLQSEAFSRYALFVDSFPSTTVLPSGLHIRGPSYGNRNWISAATPGTAYYDTLSVVGTISGASTYAGRGVAVTSAQRIKWPTSTSLASLSTLASAGGMSFAQVGTTTTSATSVTLALVGLARLVSRLMRLVSIALAEELEGALLRHIAEFAQA